jgi:hypothetical protein
MGIGLIWLGIGSRRGGCFSKRTKRHGDTQNYWGFGLFPSSGILRNRKHDVSETGSVSVLRCEEEDTYSVGSFRQT